MAQHVKILGILHIVLGGMGALAAIIVLFIFGGVSAVFDLSDRTSGGVASFPVLGAIAGFIFIVILALSLPSLITGIGLVQFRPWARVMGIIMSGLHLFNIPFGTALGIYGLWVLLKPETERMFLAAPARFT